MFAHKALAFLFVSSTDIWQSLAWNRTWRIAMVILAALAVATNRRNIVVMVLAGFAAYMWVVHIPLLYTHRYSVGAIDFPLALLAGIGVGEALRSAGRVAAASVALCVCLAAGLANAVPAPGSPMPERIPTEVAWLGEIDREAVVRGSEPIDISIPKDPATPLWDLSMVQLDLAVHSSPGRCEGMRLAFRRANEAAFQPYRVVRVALEAGEAVHRYTVGTTTPLALDGAGTLRIVLECTAVARVDIGTVAVLLPRRERYYSELYRQRR